MDKDEALRFALEALEAITKSNQSDHQAEIAEEAITAIKAALEAKDEPWSPVSIGVDVTKEGAHVVGIYALDKDTSQIFYAKHHPASQRTWAGLTADEMLECLKAVDAATAVNLLMSQYKMPPTFKVYAEAIQAKLKEKNT
jgi:hypothetical protein